MAGIVIRVRMSEISNRLKTNSIIFSPMIMIKIRARKRAERSIADHSEGEFILYLYDDGQIQMLLPGVGTGIRSWYRTPRFVVGAVEINMN